MNRSQFKQYFLLTLSALMLLITAVGCNSAEQPVSVPEPREVIQVPPLEPTAPPVEYGASLDEWSAAAQTDTVQKNNNKEPVEVSNSDDSQSVVLLSEPNIASAAIDNNATTFAPTLLTINDVVYQEIVWDQLVPAGFTADDIMDKYQEELSALSDNSEGANELYLRMQAEFENAPVNESINGQNIRLAGFIAPLEYSGEEITEFLLVPYFGACIHVPPPPANQTVLVKLADGHGIKVEDSYYPFWIMGELTAEGTTTDLAQAGYYINNAIIELYAES